MEFGINIKKTISSLIPSLLQITFFISDEVGVVECLHHRVVSERETMSEKKFRFRGWKRALLSICCCCRLQYKRNSHYIGCVSLRHGRKFIDNRRKQRQKNQNRRQKQPSRANFEEDNFVVVSADEEACFLFHMKSEIQSMLQILDFIGIMQSQI